MQSQFYHAGARKPLVHVQCNYYCRPGHTIDKCFKLQRLGSEKGHSDRGRRIAASVQQSDTSLDMSSFALGQSNGQHTLTS